MGRINYDMGRFGKKKPLIEGIFNGEIYLVLEKKTKSGDDMLSLKILINGDDGGVIEIWDNIVFHRNEQNVEKMAKHLMAFFSCVGIPVIEGKVDFESFDLKGKKIKVKIGIRKSNEYNPEDSNIVIAYLPELKNEVENQIAETNFSINQSETPF